MQDALLRYFDGEKNAGLFLAGIGLVTIVAAVIFVRAQLGLRTFVVTLVVLALAEIALGVGLHFRTGPQVRRLIAQMASEESRFYSEEGPRMVRVQRDFRIIEFTEVAIIILSAIVALTLKGRPAPMGIALGLLIHASILLAFDLIAERRGATYLTSIESGSRADLR